MTTISTRMLYNQMATEPTKVLVVDDSDSALAHIGGILSMNGAVVTTAQSGAEALSALSNQNFDLVVLDMILPDENGLDVLSRMRETNKDTAVLVLTSEGSISVAVETMRRGGDGFYEKKELPATDQFLKAIDQALKQREGVKAKRALQAIKRRFYSMIVHDLRAPVGNARLLLQLVRDAGPLSEEQITILDVLNRSLAGAEQLCQDFLDVEQATERALTLHRQNCDLAALLRDHALGLRAQAAARRLDFLLSVPEDPATARVDPRRILQVVDNLFGNAVKSTPVGGHVELGLGRTSDGVVIRIRDTGVGMTHEQLQALRGRDSGKSEIFRSTVQAGHGLGVMIVKEIVQGHEGKLHVTSDGPGKGSCFEVTLPSS